MKHNLKIWRHIKSKSLKVEPGVGFIKKYGY